MGAKCERRIHRRECERWRRYTLWPRAEPLEGDTAERAVVRIHGVRGIVSQLTVLLPGEHQRTDEDIAHVAIDALRWNSVLPKDLIKVKGTKGVVTLSGMVSWRYEQEMAERTVSRLIGVRGVTNDIDIKSKAPTIEQVKSAIEAALKRSAQVEARRIHVETNGATVVLSGTVDSWSELRATETAAWASLGVTHVENNINVGIAAGSAVR